MKIPSSIVKHMSMMQIIGQTPKSRFVLNPLLN